jgi:uroporphyrinogen-III decarboxylase
MSDNYLRCYRGLAEMPGDGTINYDDTTTMAISPQMFRELEVPFLNQTADILHAADKLCIHHACGHVEQLLEDFQQTRIDGFDGPAAPPVGNTTVARAREGLGPGIAIMPFAEEYAMKSNDPATVRGAIRTMFEEAGSPEGFAVNLGAPPGCPVESLWLAVDEAKRLSRTYF